MQKRTNTAVINTNSLIIDEIGHQKGLKYLIEDVLTPAQKDFVKHQINLHGNTAKSASSLIQSGYGTTRKVNIITGQ